MNISLIFDSWINILTEIDQIKGLIRGFSHPYKDKIAEMLLLLDNEHKKHLKYYQRYDSLSILNKTQFHITENQYKKAIFGLIIDNIRLYYHCLYTKDQGNDREDFVDIILNFLKLRNPKLTDAIDISFYIYETLKMNIIVNLLIGMMYPKKVQT